MNKRILFAGGAVLFLFLACSKPNVDGQNQSRDIWDIEKDGIPKLSGTNYIDVDKIDSISKFRSSIGHDYSDAFEHCRSMKHYFMLKTSVDWGSVKVFAPVSGIITRAEVEGSMGTKFEIASDSLPAFRFSVFHVNPLASLKVNDHVAAGQQLGTHIGSQTYSDISVIVNDITRQGRFVSYFDVLTDAAFQAYVGRGVKTRDDLKIPAAVRDANPLTCSGDQFVSTDTLKNWVGLN